MSTLLGFGGEYVRFDSKPFLGSFRYVSKKGASEGVAFSSSEPDENGKMKILRKFIPSLCITAILSVADFYAWVRFGRTSDLWIVFAFLFLCLLFIMIPIGSLYFKYNKYIYDPNDHSDMRDTDNYPDEFNYENHTENE